MSEVKKRVFEVLGRVVGFVTANSDLFGKARSKKAPSLTVIQTRKTLDKTTKRSTRAAASASPAGRGHQ